MEQHLKSICRHPTKPFQKEKPKAQELLKGTEIILLVDDEHMVIDIGKEILEKLGYTVITAASGSEALRLFKKNQKIIDLVILDMIMPDMSGRDTFENLKACQANVKVLLSSGYSIEGQATEILNSGCKGFISETVQPDAAFKQDAGNTGRAGVEK